MEIMGVPPGEPEFSTVYCANSQPRRQIFTFVPDDPSAMELIGLYPGCHGKRVGVALKIGQVDVGMMRSSDLSYVEGVARVTRDPLIRVVIAVEIGGLGPLINFRQNHASGPFPVQEFVGGIETAGGVVLVTALALVDPLSDVVGGHPIGKFRCVPEAYMGHRVIFVALIRRVDVRAADPISRAANLHITVP